MARIDFGPWRPDAEGVDRNILVDVVNTVPTLGGFRPVGNIAANSVALPDKCIGSASFLDETGSGITFAGTAAGLFRLASDRTWTDVTNAGGAYTTGSGERWNFAQFGTLGIATNFTDPPQKIDLTDPVGVFEDLGGNPPHARYVAVVASFLEFGNLSDAGAVNVFPSKVQWSGLNDAEGWTAGVNSSGEQTFLDGGPVQGLVGGDVGYAFQSQGIQRQIFVPASDLIFQFDKVETERGLLAPGSLQHIAREIYFLDRNGFYIFDIRSNSSKAIGVDKVDVFFNGNKRSNTDLLINSAFDPVNHFVFWSYVSDDTVGIIPDRVLVYNWETKEFGKVNLKTTAFVQYITERVSLDALDPFGTMETLQFSLDSPFWSGGNVILGVFGSDDKLSNLTGPFLEAQFETPDAQLNQSGRSYISGITPVINANQVFAKIGFRERLGDTIQFTAEEEMESTGEVPVVASGRYLRARLRIPTTVAWNLAQGVDPIVSQDGGR